MRRAAFTLLTALAWAALLAPAASLAAGASPAEASLRAFFARGVTHEGARAELVSIGRLPEAHGALRWRLPRLNGHPSRFSVIAETGHGRAARRWFVPVRVRWWARAAIAATDIPARALLQTGMIRTAITDIADHHGNWWPRAAEALGLKTIAPIAKGALLTGDRLKTPPVIRRGDPVVIRVDHGALHLRVAGRALRSAARGQRLMVENIRSRQRLPAIAEGPGVVVLAGGAG